MGFRFIPSRAQNPEPLTMLPQVDCLMFSFGSNPYAPYQAAKMGRVFALHVGSICWLTQLVSLGSLML